MADDPYQAYEDYLADVQIQRGFTVVYQSVMPGSEPLGIQKNCEHGCPTFAYRRPTTSENTLKRWRDDDEKLDCGHPPRVTRA